MNSILTLFRSDQLRYNQEPATTTRPFALAPEPAQSVVQPATLYAILWQFHNRYVSALDGLNHKLVAIEEGHSDERVGVSSIYGHSMRHAIPHDCGLVNVENSFAAIC